MSCCFVVVCFLFVCCLVCDFGFDVYMIIVIGFDGVIICVDVL